MNWIEGEHYYVNKEGKVVLTEKYHLLRGYCCSNGCLHCAYEYENVPEPKRTELLNERQQKASKEPR
ncbi:DUF5522 domain-containing protein [Niabella ginsengisoli]|uniref:DUF5522 domain-containing protein n=1 Tax=Niabella ginsengisoli TaxID=522298 RepID=A0ABS9SMY0_9BACT|nr:DUF5522 domain-containing protein [Niabella ginsengisoli]MCH5599720.1 DUF5522 domain-containing protein [Niabella ginsengisoli]